MKHLLILLSFLLLSSPVIGQETGVLYLWETSSGIKWTNVGENNFHPKYKGEIKNGKPDGVGILDNGFIFNEDTDYEVGGEVNTSFKSKYIGEWKNGLPHGQGNLLVCSGEITGECTEGLGRFRGKYTGEFREGKRWNTIIKDTKGIITSKVVNGESKTWNSEIYNPRDGKLYRWVNGVVGIVEGHRLGILYFRKINGERGWYEDGDTSENMYYLGYLKNEKFHGSGTINNLDGSKVEGEFRNGEKWDTKKYDKNRKITEIYINGVKQ